MGKARLGSPQTRLGGQETLFLTLLRPNSIPTLLAAPVVRRAANRMAGVSYPASASKRPNAVHLATMFITSSGT